MAGRTQISIGVGLAGLSALLFGVTAPIVQRATTQADTFVSGSLLYLGAAVGAAVSSILRRDRTREAPLRRHLVLPLVAVALLGAVCAPALLILGLKRTDAATATLLLALEAPFTALFARLIDHEHLGRRVLTAVTLVFAGGALLAAGAPGLHLSREGALLVTAAASAWALDNVVSRSLADRDPLMVVCWKGFLGAGASAAAALLVGGFRVPLASALTLLLTGALGYGLSLQLYLRAQRLVGAARTASVFATAPFVGAAAAFAFGAPWPGWRFPVAAALMLIGVALHAAERHRHLHTHDALEHEHLHSHDDGHHDHPHDPPVAAPHSHWHRHEPVTHEHEHSEDVHHRHRH